LWEKKIIEKNEKNSGVQVAVDLRNLSILTNVVPGSGRGAQFL